MFVGDDPPQKEVLGVDALQTQHSIAKQVGE